MSSLPTSARPTARRAGEAFALSRAQILGIALLACVPLPLLSVGTTFLPIAEMVERAAANLIPLVAPGLGGGDGAIFRERGVALRRVDIRPGAWERPGIASAAEATGGVSPVRPAGSGPKEGRDGAASARPNDESSETTASSSEDVPGNEPADAPPTSDPSPAEPGVDRPGGGADPRSDPDPSGGTADGAQDASGNADPPAQPDPGNSSGGANGDQSGDKGPPDDTGPPSDSPGNGGPSDGTGGGSADPPAPPAPPAQSDPPGSGGSGGQGRP